jgi:O-succinylbenzoate synthase
VTPEQFLASVRCFALPLKREFRGVTVREGLLFEGPSGWAEFAPFQDHTVEHAARWLEAALEQAYGHWPALVRHEVPVNAIIPMCDPETATAWTEDALDRGCTTIKVKVGSAYFDDDVARVAAIRAALDDALVAGAIRIDTNQLWTVEQAVERIGVLDAIAGGLQYVEQPVASRDDLLQVRRRVDVRIAVDEGIRLDDDPAAVVAALREVADVAVLKSIPLGGVQKALELASECELPVVVSGSLDTSVGIASGLWLSGSLAELPFACGLGTGTLFLQDVADDAQRIVDGHLLVKRVVPEHFDPAGLVDAAMRERWRARLMEAWKHADIPAAVKAS